jgi:hypothetical protein
LLLGNNLTGTQYDFARCKSRPVQVASPLSNSVLLYALPTVNPGVTVRTSSAWPLTRKAGVLEASTRLLRF